MRFPTLKQISMNCSSARSDITTYIEGIVQEKLKTEELIVGDPDLIEDIKAALLDGANGMFLWVVFQVNELCLQHCDEDIRSAIRNFPKDLDETFNRVIDRIVSRGNESIAKRIFRLVAAAKEPLSLDQLAEIVFVEIGQEYSKTERQSNGIAHISSWCENFVYVDEELRTVQFMHQTVQQFFIERSSESRNNQFHLNLEDADHFLGEICVTYLNFNDFKTTLARRQQPLPLMPPIAIAGTALRPQWKAILSIPALLKLNLNTRGGLAAANAIEALEPFQRNDTWGAKERLLEGHPFLGYASIYWIFHTTMFQKEKSKTWGLWEKIIVQGHDLVEKPWIEESFSQSIPVILDWSQKVHHYALIRLILLTGKLLDLKLATLWQSAVADEDIMLLDILLEHDKSDIIIIDQACEAAARLGRLDAMERLLAAGADGQKALLAAALSGQQNTIMRLLTAGIDGQIALQATARREDISSATSLLDAGVDGQLALRDLIDSAHLDVIDPRSSQAVLDFPSTDLNPIKILLAAGVDGQPILQTAVKGGHQVAIAFLLAAGIDGEPELLAASKSDNQDIMKLLLAAGADGRTALLNAARNYDLDAIKSFLAAGVDGQDALQTAVTSGEGYVIERLLAAGVYGQPILQAAADNDDLHTIKLLLANGVNSQTVMSTAVEQDCLVLIEKLLTAGVRMSASTTSTLMDRSGLKTAAQQGHINIIETLLAFKPESNVLFKWDLRSALAAASRCGHLDIVERFLAARISVNGRSIWDDQPALQAASRGGHLDIVERLLAAGSKVNTYDTPENPTALQAACQGGHLDVVKRLLAAGAKVNENGKSRNALLAASEGGHFEVVETLLAAGAKVDKNSKSGNALLAASEGGHVKVVEGLLAAGFEVNTRKTRWWARIALQAASQEGHLKVVERLLAAGANVNLPVRSRVHSNLQLAARVEVRGLFDD
ncbi:NACHT domain protein [Trichoderma guizhouense]|uniref:NACHT domain protein n=1 Tax=Trichoderma guizhouense TaxID=1491466 RepID=A0A1T3CU52_9HYPO|nr:NACHT domain protein [Trichoderma guizhouense]